MELKVKRTERAKQFPLLHIQKNGDVGLDVHTCLPYDGSIMIHPGDMMLIPTGISLEIPHGYWIAVEARSSTSRQSLIVPKGVIDEGYRGEIFAQIMNVGKRSVKINHGDRLVQLILRKNYTSDLQITEVDELAPSERGDSGFGSTGK